MLDQPARSTRVGEKFDIYLRYQLESNLRSGHVSPQRTACLGGNRRPFNLMAKQAVAHKPI